MVPLYGFGVVLRNAAAVVVHLAEARLCVRVSLVGGSAVPLYGFEVVLPNTLAVVVHRAEACLHCCITKDRLRRGITPLGRPAEPPYAFLEVLRDTSAVAAEGGVTLQENFAEGRNVVLDGWDWHER